MIQDTIQQSIEFTYNSQLAKALSLLKPIFQAHPKLRDSSEIEDIDNAFRMMLHYMRQNADDPDRKKLYHSLLRRTYRVAADLDISWRCKNVGFYVTQFQKAAHLNMSPDFIRTVLETFVSDVAMLSLDGDTEEAKQKKTDIYTRHQNFIERLFAAITISCQWSEGERDFWSRLLVSPTIDNADALVITSAISISAMNQFDANKTRALAIIYRDATDTALKQRSLIGFVFSLKAEPLRIFTNINNVVDEVTKLPDASHDLLELQEQLFYCMNAEQDNKKIENEIMPDLTKNVPYRVNGTGMIEETPPDKMRDILHPDADDKAMEQVEQSIQKIADMQRQGADIYFGGFSKMKRFPFFSVAANWFLPYSADQPEIAKIREKVGKGKFIDLLLTKSAFCESDKYSFTFAVNAIFDRMPPALREMMNSSEAMTIEVPDEEVHTATFIRRQYLQDIYRFSRIHPQRGDLDNIFDKPVTVFFFQKPYFEGTAVDKHRPSLAVFLYDQKRFNELRSLLTTFNDRQRDTFTYWLLKASTDAHFGDNGSAVDSFQKALEKAPDNDIALKGLARAAMLYARFETADEAYSKLLELEPGHKSYLINRGLALIYLDKLDDAASVTYEADYRYPNDKSVKRLKGWLLLNQHKPEEALGVYKELTEQPPTDEGNDNGTLPEDFLNMGYALWVTHDIEGTANALTTYTKTAKDGDLYQCFIADKKLLVSYGIDDEDVDLMMELVDLQSIE